MKSRQVRLHGTPGHRELLVDRCLVCNRRRPRRAEALLEQIRRSIADVYREVTVPAGHLTYHDAAIHYRTGLYEAPMKQVSDGLALVKHGACQHSLRHS